MKRFIIVLGLMWGLMMLIAGCAADTKEPAPEAAKPAAVKTETTVATAVPKGITVLMYHKVVTDEDNDALIR